ncbi:uncharacterized protein TRIVIDRAFT_66059 [Trichoderma virens Gv29-8]|uniref:Vacuolar ATPase assembly protein VMA22 n=1 Tax=Hypocrea virens (strain Gv29-8 / FGSC 10586) TaxID=413071 RepID=G9N7Y7_HYPVG|nr:uncharacterized protein TRIVIDRAFT_66059 [Trichoderma virens Gv29-8]EHK17099.1 hypothetical protein TRIVIDRAFT_66059 [Trichoderma virens Gv29-8]
MDQDHIDSLLASLLNLVHEYEALQLELSKLTSGVHLNLAKANFAGERGMRYDADHFNGAMRATRGIKITDGEDGVPVFTYKKLDSPPDEEDQEEDEKQEDSPEGESAAAAAQENSEASPEGKDEDKEEQDKKKTKKVNRDPLNRFGLLVPAPLREAKSLSIQMVEQIIPRIASIKARIADVEIEIRRAKKKRAKAEAAAAAAAAQAEKEAAEAS